MQPLHLTIKQSRGVYFYPADLTSVCTSQACSFRDQHAALEREGVKVVGISGDSVKTHKLFKKTHSLEFPLLSDSEGRVADRFGVPTRRGGKITRVIDGRQQILTRGVTARRWTFVIGLDGRIVTRNTNVEPANDGRQVLNLVRQLTASNQ